MQKVLSLILFSASGLFAQTTLTFTFPATNEPAVSAVFTAAAVSAMAASAGYSTVISGYPPLTLAAGIGAGTTTVTVTSAALANTLVSGSGLLIDSEIMNVVSVSGTSITTIRGMFNTTAATHAAAATATALRFGSYGSMIKAFVQQGFILAPPPATNPAGSNPVQ